MSNLAFPQNAILLCVFLFFLINDLYFVISETTDATTESLITTWKPTNEANTEIETQPVTVEARISKYSI